MYIDNSLIDSFYLDVDAVNKIFIATYGNRQGIPVIYLHGGPGGSCSKESTVFFDPDKYFIITFDQRGCGKSLPFMSTHNNDIFYLASDIIKIIDYLKIDKVNIFGASFGTTLGLTFAINYPDRVSNLVLSGIFLGRDEDVNWLYKFGATEFYPYEYEKYLEVLQENKRKDPISSYHELFSKKNCDDKFYISFSNYERKISRLSQKQIDYHEEASDSEKSIAFFENYYFYNRTFKDDDNYIINNIKKIKDIKTHIIHGRYDLICRPSGAYLLHKHLPNSTLEFITLAGHSCFEIESMNKITYIFDTL